MGLFDFNANQPLSYEALQMRRKIAETLAARRERPPIKNIGEGIFSAAESLSNAFDQKSLEAQLAQYEKNYQADVDKRYGAGGQSFVVPLGNSPAAAPPVVVPPVRLSPVRPARRADLYNPYSPPIGQSFDMGDYRDQEEDTRYG